MIDPTLNLPQLGVSAGCGVAAVVAHLATVYSGPPAAIPTRRQLLADSFRTLIVGMAVALLLDWQKFLTFTLLPSVVISAVIGAVLGPRGLRWLFAGMTAVLAVWAPQFKPPPEDKDV